MDLLSTRIRITQTKLLQDPRLRTSDHSTYSLLFWYPSSSLYTLAQQGSVPYETLRRAVRRLVETDWVFQRPGPWGAIYVPWMPLDVEELLVAELEEIYDQVPYKGEWLMQCLLDLLIRDPHRYENSRPTYLVTGEGSGRLELDRMYPRAKLAFEFQGEQHYRVGPLNPTEEDLQEQVMRDHIKASICNTKGIRLFHLRYSDLNYHSLTEKLEGLVDLYPIRETRPLFKFVDDRCRRYINYGRREERKAVRKG